MNRTAARSVTVIPPTINPLTHLSRVTVQKRRVAGYARVSTDSDVQFTSYEAQVDYYTQYIKRNPEWEFVKVYTDEGISGTNTKHRIGFNEMIADATTGKIDLIVTKSVSRFARNTVDSLVTFRKLKGKGREFIAARFETQIFDVVYGGMPEHELVLPFQKRFDLLIKMRERRIFFKFFVIVRKDDPVAPAVGQMKFAVGVDEDVLFFDDIELFVAHAIAENADFCHIFIDARAFDIEKNVFHDRRPYHTDLNHYNTTRRRCKVIYLPAAITDEQNGVKST